MTIFTIDTTSPEAPDIAERLAFDLNEFLDDTGYLHYAAGPTEVKEIAAFLLEWFSGDRQRQVSAEAVTPNAEKHLWQQRMNEFGDVLAKLTEAREQRKGSEPFCMPQYRRQTSETQ